jgi:hypothetical protein
MAVGTDMQHCLSDNVCPCVGANHIFDQFLAQMAMSASVSTTEHELGPNGMAKIHQIGGRRDALTGGHRDALTGGHRDALIGGHRDALIGGRRDALIGGRRDALVGGHRDALTGGRRDALIGGRRDALTGGHVVPDSCYCTTGGSHESDSQYRPARPVWISVRPRGQFDQLMNAGVIRPEGQR